MCLALEHPSSFASSIAGFECGSTYSSSLRRRTQSSLSGVLACMCLQESVTRAVLCVRTQLLLCVYFSICGYTADVDQCWLLYVCMCALHSWATHGGKTDKNAHPHMDYSNRIALVHNGTINNANELRRYVSLNFLTVGFSVDQTGFV
jgi:Glutamine amidotransferase domain